MNDTFPLDFGFLEVDQKTQAEAGGAQIVEALRGVVIGETIHAFQLDHQYVLDEDICKILSNVAAFVGDRQ